MSARRCLIFFFSPVPVVRTRLIIALSRSFSICCCLFFFARFYPSTRMSNRAFFVVLVVVGVAFFFPLTNLKPLPSNERLQPSSSTPFDVTGFPTLIRSTFLVCFQPPPPPREELRVGAFLGGFLCCRGQNSRQTETVRCSYPPPRPPQNPPHLFFLPHFFFSKVVGY